MPVPPEGSRQRIHLVTSPPKNMYKNEGATRNTMDKPMAVVLLRHLEDRKRVKLTVAKRVKKPAKITRFCTCPRFRAVRQTEDSIICRDVFLHSHPKAVF